MKWRILEYEMDEMDELTSLSVEDGRVVGAEPQCLYLSLCHLFF